MRETHWRPCVAAFGVAALAAAGLTVSTPSPAYAASPIQPWTGVIVGQWNRNAAYGEGHFLRQVHQGTFRLDGRSAIDNSFVGYTRTLESFDYSTSYSKVEVDPSNKCPDGVTGFSTQTTGSGGGHVALDPANNIAVSVREAAPPVVSILPSTDPQATIPTTFSNSCGDTHPDSYSALAPMLTFYGFPGEGDYPTITEQNGNIVSAEAFTMPFTLVDGTVIGSETWNVAVHLTRNPDRDFDGVPDTTDACPDTFGTLANGCADDTDGDGVPNSSDNCPTVANTNQADLDQDHVGDACDPDIDGDNLSNTDETAHHTDPRNPDTDGGGTNDGTEVSTGTNPLDPSDDMDTDKDGVSDAKDNCRTIPNATQADLDQDRIGDACDPDIDGDRLLNSYETDYLGSNPRNVDSDGDGFKDPVEAASGSNLINASITPNTLPAGTRAIPRPKLGDAGITCGKTQSDWSDITAAPTGVKAGSKACILLISNAAANAIVDQALSYGPNITGALFSLIGPYLVEQYGQQAIDWAKQQEVDYRVWQTRRALKQAILESLNLTRLNAIFTVGQTVGLAGIVLGGTWALNQFRNNNACIQVSLGTKANSGMYAQWNLVYSSEHARDPNLSQTGIWEKHPRRFAPDTVDFKPSNLTCSYGRVVSTRNANQVFGSTGISHVF